MTAHWLIETFREYEKTQAIVWNGRECTYDELLQKIHHWQHVFIENKIEPGESIAFQGDYSPDVCALFLALVDNGNVAVPIANTVEKNLDDLLNTARATGFYKFSEDDKWAFIRRPQAEADHPLLDQLKAERRPGLILFTSGSTGTPKAVVHDFDECLSNIRTKRAPWRALVFLLLDHIGGVNTLMNILRNGGAAISTDSRSPESICQLIEKYRIELLPTSPTFINMLLISKLYEEYDLSSLKVITYGTERMALTTLNSLNEALPAVRCKQTYGMSELGIMPTKSKDSQSLWMKIGGDDVKTKVVDGILWIKKKSSMLGYLNAPSPFDEEGWFNTQDEVEVEGEYFRVLGRKSDIINVGGEKVYPAEVESVLLQMDNVRDVTIRSKKNPISGQIVVANICLDEPEELNSLKQRILEHCKGRLTRNQTPMVVRIDESPVYSERYKKIR